MAYGDDFMRLRSLLQTNAEQCYASLVVLDFDGTLTDADAHAPLYHEASKRELARRLNWNSSTLEREWSRALTIVNNYPFHTAWVVDGHGVCPATADPYLIANSVNRMILSEQFPNLANLDIASGVLEIHHAAYESIAPPFKPDARGLLETLCRQNYHVAVVTNSSTQTAKRLLESLNLQDYNKIIVRGNANKFSVHQTDLNDKWFSSLPETINLPELPRPIYPRRGKYFDVLREIWDITGTTPESTLVAGDVFELDLAMPAALGAHVHLVTRKSTMPHEKILAGTLARGAADHRLAAIIERLGG
jgi:FMN phosphatase YigB (HAD superfamily)